MCKASLVYLVALKSAHFFLSFNKETYVIQILNLFSVYYFYNQKAVIPLVVPLWIQVSPFHLHSLFPPRH